MLAMMTTGGGVVNQDNTMARSRAVLHSHVHVA
jgi:hypothetical protein